MLKNFTTVCKAALSAECSQWFFPFGDTSRHKYCFIFCWTPKKDKRLYRLVSLNGKHLYYHIIVFQLVFWRVPNLNTPFFYLLNEFRNNNFSQCPRSLRIEYRKYVKRIDMTFAEERNSRMRSFTSSCIYIFFCSVFQFCSSIRYDDNAGYWTYLNSFDPIANFITRY